MAKIIKFTNTKKKRPPMSAEEYLDILNAIEQLTEELYPSEKVKEVQELLHEMRWNGQFNSKFREETRDEAEKLLGSLYIDSQERGN